ncbi:MAG TPA: hypothetical protein VHB97_16625 [Polyangia bacterium]|nr:hypothetical protein [Polyangia bacterium]
MGEAESKGSGFTSAVTILRKMLAADKLERIVASLSTETAELVRRPPLPVAWIGVQHFPELVRAVRADGFGGDEKKFEEWGRQAMLNDLRTIYKMFIRFLSPQFVIERGAKLWQTYTRNQGGVRAAADGPSSAVVTYEGLPPSLVSPEFWAYQRGVLLGVMEATGMKQVGVETLGGGAATTGARFRVSWK